MIHHALIVLVLFFASCVKVAKEETIQKSDIPKTETPNSANKLMEKLKVANDFSYQTVKSLDKKLILRDGANKRLSNQKIYIYQNSIEAKNLLKTQYTDIQGELNIKINIGMHINKVMAVSYANGKKLSYIIYLKKENKVSLLYSFFDFIFPSAHANDVESYFPSKCSMGTLAYEDLWPSKGDYDFNDLVVNYNYKNIKDDSGEMKKMVMTFQVMATGAGFSNGFAVRLPIPQEKIKSVTGNYINDWFYNINTNGTEKGNSQASIIIAGNVNKLFPYFGNVYKDQGVSDAIEIRVVVEFNSGLSENELGLPPYDPFIIVNRNRKKEVHLADKAPTELADMSLFKTKDDNSIPGISRYYKTEKNLPWALHFPYEFNHMLERKQITFGYKKFKRWAESKGSLDSDWYVNQSDNTNYRDTAQIFPHRPNILNSFLETCESNGQTDIVVIEEGGVSEEEVTTEEVSVDLSKLVDQYQDEYNTNITVKGFDSKNGTRELIEAKLFFNLKMSHNILGRNTGDPTQSGLISIKQTAKILLNQIEAAAKETSKEYAFNSIPPSTEDEYQSYLDTNTSSEKFEYKVHEEDVMGNYSFKGEDAASFIDQDQIANISHTTFGKLLNELNKLSYRLRFKITGTLGVKYISRSIVDRGVTFVDKNLEAKMRSIFKIPTGRIDPTDCLGITSINLSELGITNLSGLEICTDLEEEPPLLSESLSKSSTSQMSFSNLTKGSVSYDEAVSFNLDIDQFDENGVYELKKVVMTYTLESSCNIISKNFNSESLLSGEATTVHNVNFEGSFINKYFNLSTNQYNINEQMSFQQTPQSTLTQYEDYRNSGDTTNADLFKKNTCANSLTKTVEITNTDDLQSFVGNGLIQLPLTHRGTFNVNTNSDEDLSFDGEFETKVQVDIEYSYGER